MEEGASFELFVQHLFEFILAPTLNSTEKRMKMERPTANNSSRIQFNKSTFFHRIQHGFQNVRSASFDSFFNALYRVIDIHLNIIASYDLRLD